MNKEDIKKFIVSALVGATFWTACLAPYMIFVVGVRGEAVVRWVAMQFVLIPPLAPFAIKVDRKVMEWLFNNE